MDLPLSIIITPDELRREYYAERERDTLPMLAIYKNPKDYPGAHVVRLWRIVRTEPTPQASAYCVLATSLEQARAMLPPGLARIGRADGDDPCILETWL